MLDHASAHRGKGFPGWGACNLGQPQFRPSGTLAYAARCHFGDGRFSRCLNGGFGLPMISCENFRRPRQKPESTVARLEIPALVTDKGPNSRETGDIVNL